MQAGWNQDKTQSYLHIPIWFSAKAIDNVASKASGL